MIKKKFLACALLTIFSIVLFREITPHQHSGELSFKAITKTHYKEHKGEHESHHHGNEEGLSNFFNRLIKLDFPYIVGMANIDLQRSVSITLSDVFLEENCINRVYFSDDCEVIIFDNEPNFDFDFLVNSISLRGPPSIV